MTTYELKSGVVAPLSAPPRPFSIPPRKSDVLDILVRAAVVQAYAQTHERTSIEQARAIIARKQPRYSDEVTKIICRAATAPATTFEEGWAAEFLVAQGADLIVSVMPRSAFAQLAALGMHLTFSFGDILVPDFIPSAPGVFVRQGEPIPVIQGVTTGQMLTRKKMACIVSYTGEINETAIVTLEGLLRTRIQESTSVALDAVLLDNQAATDARPAGLLNGAVAVTSSGSMQGDMQSLAEGLFALANHVVRAPVLIMNSAQAFAARLQFNREFIPIIVSPSIAAGTVVMLDASDFACASAVPRFEVSKESALHFEDSAPEPLDTGRSVKSLWQEELLGLRMILEVDWLMRRPGVACYMEDVHWTLGGR